MIYYTVYLANGDITRAGVCPTDDLSIQAGIGENVIEAFCSNTDAQWVVDGKVVDLPIKPTDSPHYYFDYSQKKWVFDIPLATSYAILERDNLLKDGPDRISPLWWESMPAETKATWTKYRQDLLDVPNQSGFPKTIVWPIRPDVG